MCCNIWEQNACRTRQRLLFSITVFIISEDRLFVCQSVIFSAPSRHCIVCQPQGYLQVKSLFRKISVSFFMFLYFHQGQNLTATGTPLPPQRSILVQETVMEESFNTLISNKCQLVDQILSKRNLKYYMKQSGFVRFNQNERQEKIKQVRCKNTRFTPGSWPESYW